LLFMFQISVFVNPCRQPIALPAQPCSTSRPCSAGTYCHYGLTPETTICCSLEGNPCDQPLVTGIGSGSQQRWYYNAQRGTCEMFLYKGLKGNANNFLSQQSCEHSCRPNPCAEGKHLTLHQIRFQILIILIIHGLSSHILELESFKKAISSGRPYSTPDGRYLSCDVSLEVSSCPSGYWCNPGATRHTAVCCPGAVADPCTLPVITGEGDEELERYYYDAATKTCRAFTYRGMKGNQNNFLTMTACEQQCQPLENPCIGQPATTAAGQVIFCSATNKEMCPVNFWCHVGATPETTVCCPGGSFFFLNSVIHFLM
uniref:BPTI/Kunitz inhibitor domain-containing protein n=1 Tax=Gongylonema pulchrum TaxID=637853 RepID=A0A183D2D2_9BILA